ncbi:MAG: UDP-N-acetylmuramoyl-L-alanine--D-glutamate ligase [Desulfobacteraceae bacterium 4572_35.2]|nr:MAG: UDP-N-acetylmuramoyl-L-alanine--D-glutamate ligase [Desulfobacteraceae bacterium 4572_35.2]
MELKGKNIVVVGAGRSGLAVCRYALDCGAQVVLSDRRSIDQILATDDGSFAALRSELTLDLDGHSQEPFIVADLIVISPGVPLTIAALQAAQQAGVEIIGEIELASRQLRCPILAITGTNGKSTTTELLGVMLQHCGQQVFVGGNLGTPLISANACQPQSIADYAVVELSSFQLESVDQFKPRYAAVLNISLDHLDRYPDMESYIAAKGAIFNNQTADDVAILNGDDAEVLRISEHCRAQKVLFSSQQRLDQGMSYANGIIEWRGYGPTLQFNTCELCLRGIHNVENVMAAMIAPLLEGFDPQQLWQAACAFKGLPHRMVLVRELDGVRWYNDSKGTNPGSVMKSVAGLQQPVTLIAGGKDKGGDYCELRDCFSGRVTQFILIGQAADKMEQAWRDIAPIYRADNMQQAVTYAYDVTDTGGSVLLSPGCSSFDMFDSFEQRGEIFSAAVMALTDHSCVSSGHLDVEG